MNNTYSEYPYAYASGVFKGSLSSLSFAYQIPGVEIKDYKKFEEYLNQRVSECEATIEKFRAAQSVWACRFG